MGVLKVKIEFTNPTRSYFAGQTLSGHVNVILTREKSFKELVVTFFGKARVSWGKKRIKRGTKHEANAPRDFTAEEIYFNHKVSLFDAGETDVIKLSPGEHRYAFSYQIPSGIPSSFHGTFGYVRYHVGALLRKSKPYHRDREVKVPFTINGVLDLNNELAASSADEINKQTYVRTCCCIRRGPISLAMKLSRVGVVPGEFIPFTADFSNQSRSEVSKVQLSLLQEVTYYANNSSKSEVRSVLQVKRDGLKPGQKNILWHGNVLKVPSVPATKLGKCNLMGVEYLLKLEMDIYGEKNLVANMPIVVGTIPLRNNFIDLMPPAGFEPDAEFFTPVDLLGYPDLPPPTYEEAMQINPPFGQGINPESSLYTEVSFSADHADGDNQSQNQGDEDKKLLSGITKREILLPSTKSKSKSKPDSTSTITNGKGHQSEKEDDDNEDKDSDDEYDDGKTTQVSFFEGFVPKYVTYGGFPSIDEKESSGAGGGGTEDSTDM